MNYLNSRSAQGPRNGNYFNTTEDEDGLLPGGTGNFFNSPVPVPRRPGDYTLYSSGHGGGFDDGMPVFRPGEVREAPPPADAAQSARQENAVAAPEATQESQAPQPSVAAGGDDDAAEIARENALEELPPFVSVGGKEFMPYLKTMTGGSDRETADIAEAQYPGSKVRIGKSGRQIITMPPDATHTEMRPAQAWGDGPDFEVVDVPIGGREYQINAPGVSFRDVANGGAQTAARVVPAFAATAAGVPAAAVAIAEPLLGSAAADVLGIGAGLNSFLNLPDALTRGSLAHRFGSRQP